jgi:hypothetical protein
MRFSIAIQNIAAILRKELFFGKVYQDEFIERFVKGNLLERK